MKTQVSHSGAMAPVPGFATTRWILVDTPYRQCVGFLFGCPDAAVVPPLNGLYGQLRQDLVRSLRP